MFAKCHSRDDSSVIAVATEIDMKTHADPSNPEPLNLKLVPIGNSYGVRLSRPLLQKFGMEHSVIAEQRPEGLLLCGSSHSKATLEQTFTEMAAAQESWSDLDASTADGLDKLVW